MMVNCNFLESVKATLVSLLLNIKHNVDKIYDIFYHFVYINLIKGETSPQALYNKNK
jgi:hypothetical protein